MYIYIGHIVDSSPHTTHVDTVLCDTQLTFSILGSLYMERAQKWWSRVLHHNYSECGSKLSLD